MGMDKGGGGVDTSGLEKSANRAIDLQERMYDLSREDIQPWYQAGRAGLGTLLDYMGLQGGTSTPLTREQLREELLPSYTTQQQSSSGMDGWYRAPDGSLVQLTPEFVRDAQRARTEDPIRRQWWQEYGDAMSTAMNAARGLHDDFAGFTPLSTTSTKDVVDNEALNAAIEARLAEQANMEKPEYYGSLLKSFGMDEFEEDPGYAYRKQEAEKALERQMAAQGVTLGGGGYGEINPQVAKALEAQSQGMASQEYGNAYNRYVNDQMNKFNMLMGVSGMGSGATTQMQQAGQQYAGAAGQIGMDLASAQMNAQLQQQSKPSMFGQLVGLGAQAAGAYFGASDIRLKTNIVEVGKEKGHKIYEFDYLDGSGRFRGVMAQDVLEIEPEAVKMMPNGYYAVDYGKLGLEMTEVK